MKFPRILLLIPLATLPLTSPGSDDILDALRARLDAMERERDAAQKARLELESHSAPLIEQLGQERNRLQEALENTRKELLLLQSSTQNSADALGQTDADLADTNAEIEELQRRIRQDQQAFVNLLNGLRHEHQQQSQQAETARRQLEAQRDALRENMNRAEQRLHDLRASQQTLLQERDDIRTLNDQLNQDLAAARREAALAQAQVNALSSRLDLLQTELHQAHQERSLAVQENDALQQRIQSLEQELKLARENSVPPEELEHLQQELDAALAGNQRLRDALQQANQRPDLSDDLAHSERLRELLDARLKTMETKLAEAEAAHDQQHARNHDLQRALDDATSEMEQALAETEHFYQEDLEDLRAMLGETMLDLNEAQHRIQTLEAEGGPILQLEAEKKALSQARQRTQRDLRILANHIQRLRAQASAQEQREADLRREREALRNRLIELEQSTSAP